MIYDMFADFLLNYPTIQLILFLSIVIGVILIFLIKAGFKNINIIVLLICIVIIYLYAVNVISLLIFTISILTIAIILFFMVNGVKSDENS